jgi:hypothetical protein
LGKKAGRVVEEEQVEADRTKSGVLRRGIRRGGRAGAGQRCEGTGTGSWEGGLGSAIYILHISSLQWGGDGYLVRPSPVGGV